MNAQRRSRPPRRPQSPRASTWDEVIGPVYTAHGVARRLGISRHAVAQRARRKTLLSVVTSDNVVLYPAFQFAGDQVDPAVTAVLLEFRACPVDCWTVAAWFGVPEPALKGLTPRQWLADPHRDVTLVQRLAAEAAARWSAP